MITSRDNKLVKRARMVRDGKARELIFIEGVRLCEEALGAGLYIEDVFYTEKLTRDERGARALNSLQKNSERVSLVSENVFASLSDTKTPQGIILLAARPKTTQTEFANRGVDVPLIVILHRTNNPANAGAILRAAEAAGANGVIMTIGGTDIFAPKALRGSMGASFRLPLWTGASYAAALAWCAERNIKTVCADVRAARLHTEVNWTEASALIVGAESSGLNAQEIAAADASVRIPMREPVESLNVAVATGVLLYEAARQRAVVAKGSEVHFPNLT